MCLFVNTFSSYISHIAECTGLIYDFMLTCCGCECFHGEQEWSRRFYLKLLGLFIFSL